MRRSFQTARDRRSLLLLVTAGMLLFFQHPSFAIEGLPGSTWGEVSHDVDSLVGNGSMGFLNQGIDWVILPGGMTLNTFAEFRYRLRSRNNDFYNAYGPLVGMELKKSIFGLGADYHWERFPELSETDAKFQFYLRWYYNWDLKRAIPAFKALPVQGLSGSSWGELSHDTSSFIGNGIIGYVNQGIDWVLLPGGVTLNTFAEFRYRLRSRNNDFYNAYGPALGAELRKENIALGVDYFWERFPDLPETDGKVQYYLRWYFDWDLKKIGNRS